MSDKQYCKPTAEEALWESMVLWKELKETRKHYADMVYPHSIKHAAVRKLINDGQLPQRAAAYNSNCPLCAAHRDIDCRACPWPGSGRDRCISDADSLYKQWEERRCLETARPIFNLMVELYSKRITGKQACAGECECARKDEGRVEFKVGDRVKLLDDAIGSTDNPMVEFPKWNNTRVGGTITRQHATIPWVRWDNGVEISTWAALFAHLSTDERLALANRDIRPGDVFKYWDGGAEELLTLIAVDDGDPDDCVYLATEHAADPGEAFSGPCKGRGVGYSVKVGDVVVFFERLVPVGRGHLAIVMDE